ncbi:MAG: hypothetical protein AB1762_20440 [Gemmatimonadota bacterium]
MRNCVARAGAVAFLAACAPPPATDSVPNEDATIVLRPYFRDLRVVHATAGTDTLKLLLDTGGGATLLTPDRARRNGCTPRGSDIGHRMTGEAVTFARCDSLRLVIGDFESFVSPVGVFDLNALLPDELPRLDGVLALDAFLGRVITVDWSADRITVHGPTTDTQARDALPMRAATGMSGRFYSAFVPVEGRFDTLWFLLDSGNLRGTLVATAVLRDSLLVRNALLHVAGRVYDSLPITPADLAIDGALGTDFMRRGPITLDLRDRHPRIR